MADKIIAEKSFTDTTSLRVQKQQTFLSFLYKCFTDTTSLRVQKHVYHSFSFLICFTDTTSLRVQKPQIIFFQKI